MTGHTQDDEDIVEQRYSKKFLDGLSEFLWEWDEEDISEYAKFYSDNPQAGYAFHVLKGIFEKIDMFIGIGSTRNSESPWDYFSNIQSLAAFSTAITKLTEALNRDPEPPMVEKIRIADRSRVRKQMLKRIYNLDPSRRTYNSEVLEHLKDRNKILDVFLKNLYIRRSKKKLDAKTTSGIRKRKSHRAESTSHSRGEINGREVGTHEQAGTTFSRREFLTRLTAKSKDTFRWSHWATLLDFVGNRPTVFVFSICCIAVSLILSSHSLYVSLAKSSSDNASDPNLFSTLGQNVLLVFSLYILTIPFLRGARLSNEKIWFLISMTMSAVLGISSMIVYQWAPPVSAFLGSIASTAQIVATLLLIQNEGGGPLSENANLLS